MLRILIQLLAWGDIEVARQNLPERKTRLYANIQERLEFEKSEINLRYRDEAWDDTGKARRQDTQ